MPRITIEFYKPSVGGDNPQPFSNVLESIAQMNPRQRVRGAPDPAGIFTLQRNGDEFVGEAARIRMEDLPRVANIGTGQRHDVDVQEREGLSEEIHFLYDSALDVVAVQKRLHMRASALKELISDLAESPLDFHIILRRDAWERFQQMGMVRKIYFKLARPQDLAGQRRPSLRRVLEEMDEFNGVSAKVQISVERERNRGLNLDSVRELVADFRARAGDFDALSITGAIRGGDDEGSETVDFVTGRLQHTDEVPLRGRRLDPNGCRLALRRGLRAHRAYLHAYRE